MRRRQTKESAFDSAHVGAVQSWRIELNRVMQAVAIVGSVINALNRGLSPKVDLDGVTRFLPSHPLNLRKLALASVSETVAYQLYADMLSITNQFYHCAEITRSYVSGVFGMQLGSAPVANAWRQLATACLVVDDALVSNLNWIRPSGSAPARSLHARVMEEISSGLSPCVDERGIIVVPGWVERRRQPRVVGVAIPVEICSGGAWRRATITDLAERGFRLTGDARPVVGEVTSIEFAAGVAVLCTVRWRRDGWFGVSIDGTLQSTLLERLSLQGLADRAVEGRLH